MIVFGFRVRVRSHRLWADLPPGQLLIAPEWTASEHGMQWSRWSVDLLFGGQMFLRADQIPRVVKHVQVPGVNHCSIISGSFTHWMVKPRPQSRDFYRLAGYLPWVDLHLSHPQPWPVSLLVKSISTTWCSLADVFRLIMSSDFPTLRRMRPWAVDLSSSFTVLLVLLVGSLTYSTLPDHQFEVNDLLLHKVMVL